MGSFGHSRFQAIERKCSCGAQTHFADPSSYSGDFTCDGCGDRLPITMLGDRVYLEPQPNSIYLDIVFVAWIRGRRVFLHRTLRVLRGESRIVDHWIEKDFVPPDGKPLV